MVGHLKESGRRIWLAIAIIVALSFAAASPAGAATAAGTIPIGSSYAYTVAPDDTFWLTGPGYVSHLNEDGEATSGGFSSSGIQFPYAIGYYANRVYVLDYAGGFAESLESAPAGSDDNPTLVRSDSETAFRFMENANGIRITTGGGGYIAGGQSNNVHTFNPASVPMDHPFYPESTSGWGINDNEDSNPAGNDFEACVGGYGPDAVTCGRNPGRGGSDPGHLNDPTDLAPGPNGSLYVLEYSGNRVTQLVPGGASLIPGITFGSGSANGALQAPISIVRTSDGHLYVSDTGNRRISEFSAGGQYLGSFGWGVSSGTDKFETCAPSNCRVGVPTSTDPRSGFTRLDVNSDGQLYAYMPGVAQVQVISLGGSAPAQPDKIMLKADPLKVKKDDKTTLTATVKPASSCSNRSVLFERRNSQGYDHLGGSTKVGSDCKVTKKEKITKKSTFRATSIQTSNRATVKTSTTVTVKLK